MRTGNLTTCSAGDDGDIVEVDSVTTVSGGVLVSVHAREGHEQYFSLWVDGVQCGDARFLSTESTALVAPHDAALLTHRICLVPQGDWPQFSDHGSFIFQDFFAQCKNQILATITPSIEFTPAADLPMSTITFSGLQRFTNCSPVQGRPHWGMLLMDISDAAGTRSVTVRSNGVIVASGSIVGDGIVTMVEQNGSGLSGTGTIVYSGDIVDKKLWIRWPEKYELHYKVGSFVSGDFPRSADVLSSDNGIETTNIISTPILPSGTYNVLVRQVDDDENISQNLDGGGVAITLVNMPLPPDIPAYVSGGYSSTVIGFTASASVGATYNIYDSGVTGFLDVDSVSMTHVSGTGLLTQTLAAIGSDFTGLRRVLVRAAVAGVEEFNAKILTIEYAAGVVILPRPNDPVLLNFAETVGRKITIAAVLDSAKQAVAPSTLALFLWIDGAAQTFVTPVSTTAFGSLSGGVYTCTTEYTVAVNGVYTFGIKAVSAAGTMSDGVTIHGPVELTNSSPSAPTTVLIEGV